MSTPSNTSLTLIESVKQNEPGAWERFVKIYSPLLFYWCTTKAGLTREDASDVMQEVFLSVSKSIATFRRDETYGSLRGWIRVITTNKIRNHLRHKSNKAQALGGSRAKQQFEAIAEPTLGADDNPIETSILMRKAVSVLRSRFNETTYQAFWLTAMEGKPVADAAETLGLTEPAVRQACYRVRQRLRQELDQI